MRTPKWQRFGGNRGQKGPEEEVKELEGSALTAQIVGTANGRPPRGARRDWAQPALFIRQIIRPFGIWGHAWSASPRHKVTGWYSVWATRAPPLPSWPPSFGARALCRRPPTDDEWGRSYLRCAMCVLRVVQN